MGEGLESSTYLSRPFLCPRRRDFPSRLHFTYAHLCCKSATVVPVSIGENTSESTAACAACFGRRNRLRINPLST